MVIIHGYFSWILSLTDYCHAWGEHIQQNRPRTDLNKCLDPYYAIFVLLDFVLSCCIGDVSLYYFRRYFCLHVHTLTLNLLIICLLFVFLYFFYVFKIMANSSGLSCI